MAGLNVESGDWGTEFVQRLDAALKGEATQAVRRGAYVNAKAFISRQMPIAVQIAQNMTNRQFPNAYARDERRRPIPGATHLNDEWAYSVSSDRERGASLINYHPKAAMLLRGFSTPSVIVPKDFISFRTGQPVLMFPRGTNGVDFVSTSRAIQLAEPVTRPVPASQQAKADVETIPHLAIRQAFRQGRRA
jgi:hypothetical protein